MTESRSFRFHRARPVRTRRANRLRCFSECGDTLIEILVALIIIGITVVALMGVMTTSITSSAEYRSLATVDTVLKNFADAFKTEIQLQTNPSVYTNCATSYQVASEYPTSTVEGAGVTVFGTDFPPGPVTVMVGGTPIPASAFFALASPVAASDGTVSTTFALPASYNPVSPAASATYSVSLESPSTSQVFSSTPLTVTIPAPNSSIPLSAVARYRVSIASIQWWNNTSNMFDSTKNESQAGCLSNASDASGIQQVTLQATAPNLVSDTMQFIVSDPTFDPAPGPSVVVTAPATAVGSTLTFTATITGSNSVSPTGQVGWTFIGSPANPSCQTPNPSTVGGTGGTATTTCTIGPAQAGTYQVVADYSGDGNYASETGFGSVTVGRATSTTTVATNPAPPAPPPTIGSPVVFTATVASAGTVTPTGTVTWTWTFNGGAPTPACAGSTLAANGTSTCTLTNSSVAGTYQATAVYGGDFNFAGSTGVATTVASKPQFNVLSIKLQNNGGTPGRIDQGDTIAITFSGPANEGSICTSWAGDTTNETDTGTVTISGGSSAAKNTLSLLAASTDCNIGTIVLGTAAESSYVTGGSISFTNSAISWSSTTNTLTVTLIHGVSGKGNQQTVTTGSSPSYTTSPITDNTGANDPVNNLPFAVGTGVHF
jgi:type II secretory pathway pseudopilin PulG